MATKGHPTRNKPAQNVYVVDDVTETESDLYENFSAGGATGYTGPCDVSDDDDDLYENAMDPPPLPAKKKQEKKRPPKKGGVKYTADTKQVDTLILSGVLHDQFLQISVLTTAPS